MRTDPPLSRTERIILDVLMAPGSRIENSTAEAVAERGQLVLEEVRTAMRGLLDREPPLVREDFDSKLGIRFFRPTYEAAEATEDPDALELG
jgi:hypothetical protein